MAVRLPFPPSPKTFGTMHPPPCKIQHVRFRFSEVKSHFEDEADGPAAPGGVTAGSVFNSLIQKKYGRERTTTADDLNLSALLLLSR